MYASLKFSFVINHTIKTEDIFIVTKKSVKIRKQKQINLSKSR